MVWKLTSSDLIIGILKKKVLQSEALYNIVLNIVT